MVKQIWQVMRIATIIMIFALVAVGLRTEAVNAQGTNQYPAIENSTEWNASARSPDSRLTWLYDGNASRPNSGIINGQTTHVLRNRTIGRNEGTRLRMYYKKQPVQVSLSVNVINCDLEANDGFAGRVQVDIGGVRVYNQTTRGKKIESVQNRYGWELSDRTSGRRYDLKNQPDVLASDSFRPLSDSPVCKRLPSYSYEYDRYDEGCNDANAAGTRCAGSGNGNYSKKNDRTKAFSNADIDAYGDEYAINNALDGRTFTRNWNALSDARKGFDPKSELYYVDIDIDLTGEDASNNPSASPAMLQRITFVVNANNSVNANGNTMTPKMGYRKPDNIQLDESAERFFGLQGNGGRTNDFEGYGQKYAIPFGPDCGDSSTLGRIVVYDPDIAGYGDVFAGVFRRNPERRADGSFQVQQLNNDQFTALSNFVPSGAKWLKSTASGSGTKSIFSVMMEEGWQYMMVVVNPEVAGRLNPSSNVFSVRLPTDSISGLVNCRYNLDPNITGVKKTFNTYGDTLRGTGSVVNTNEDSVAGEHDWRIVKARFSSRPADLLNRTTDTISPLIPCVFVDSVNSNLTGCNGEFHRGTYAGDQSYDFSDTVGEQPLGTYICYMTAVKNPTWKNDDNNSWRYSPMNCSVAGTTPKVQVWGGDLKATGAIQTSLSQMETPSRRYGSWGEYGVFSNGKNNAMGSGAALGSSTATASSSQANWSPLTFANVPTYGNYEGNLNVPDASQSGAIVRNGDITINSIDSLIAQTAPTLGTLAQLVTDGEARRTFVINGQVTINGSLVYPSTVSSIRNIPRITIIATEGVVVGASVSRIDPMIETPQLSTCNSVRSGSNYFVQMSAPNLLRGGVCGGQLRFNSPVNVDKLYLYRTYDTADADPAEIFNLRADNILSSYVGGGIDEPIASTNSVTELPPRF